jgi:hypothetical protein
MLRLYNSGMIDRDTAINPTDQTQTEEITTNF